MLFLKKWSPAKFISLKQLSLKLNMLILLMSGQRGQTIHLLDVRNLKISTNRAIFSIGDLLKNSTPGHHLSNVTLLAYPVDRRICVITYLQQYLKRTKCYRSHDKHNKLFLSWRSPHHPVSRDTLRRWTKNVMDLAGIDTDCFKPHSTRAASTSAVDSMNVPIDTILKAVGWKGSSSFAKYYKKPVLKDPNVQYQTALHSKLN